MKKKLKLVLVFALPALVVLSICALYWEFAMRFILVVTFLVSVMAAGIAFLDIYQGDDATAQACYKLWKLFAAVAAVIMFGCYGLTIVDLMGSEFMMSVVTGLVPLFGPLFGAKVGYILKNRRRTP